MNASDKHGDMRKHATNALTSMLDRLAAQVKLEACADAELIARFTESRDERVFRVLVDRHGPLVWGVCSRILDHHQDAEDAFQATFVALAQAAESRSVIELLPAWLHEVSRRVSLKIRRTSQRRREVHVQSIPEPLGHEHESTPELAEVLDEEVGELPERLREPFILCHMENRTYEEAAAILGYSVSTVCRRVADACELLRERIARRGLAPAGTAAAILTVLATSAARAADGSIPPGLAARAVQVAVASGEATAPAVVAASVVKAVGGVKAKIFAWAAAIVAISVVGTVGLALALGGREQPAPPVMAVAAPPAQAHSPAATEPAAGFARDRHGDPLPAGSIARIGNLRFRAERAAGSGDVAFFGNGKTIASVHGTGVVLVWDVASGRVVQSFDGPSGAIWLAASPDGKKFFAAGRSEVRAWELTDGNPRILWNWESGASQRWLTALALAPDASLLAVSDPGSDQTHLIDATTGTSCGVLDGSCDGQLAFSPDTKMLVGLRYARATRGTTGSQLLCWDMASGQTIDALTNQRATSFAFDPKGKMLAWGEPGGSVKLWDLVSQKETAAWTTEATRPFLAFLPDGSLAAFGSDRMVFHDPLTGQEARPSVPAADLGIVGNVAEWSGKKLSADGSLFATVVHGQVAVWDVRTGREAGPEGRIHGTVGALAFAPDGKGVVTFSGVYSIARTWDAATGKPGTCLALTPGREAVAGNVWYGADGRPFAFMARPSEPLSVVSWDPATGKIANRQTIPADFKVDRFTTITASPDGRRLAWCARGVVTLADRESGREERRLKPKGNPGFISLAFSRDGKTLVTFAQQSRVVEIWSVETGELRTTLNLQPGPRPLLPRHLAVSPDGRFIGVTTYVTSGEQTIEIWNVATGRVEHRLQAADSLHCLSFSPDGQRLVAGAEDGSIRLWNLSDEKTSLQFRGHRHRVVAVAFSPDGGRVASGSIDGTGLIWDVSQPPVQPGKP